MIPAVRHAWWQYERANTKARDAYQRDPHAAWRLRRYEDPPVEQRRDREREAS